jgi:hypothetical protein
MIQRLIHCIETLTIDNIDRLVELYHANAVFIHPFKTAYGEKAVSRQWRMMFKYCPHTRMTIHSSNQITTGVYILQWTHTFDTAKGQRVIPGVSVIVYDGDSIVFHKDDFDLDQFHAAFK